MSFMARPHRSCFAIIVIVLAVLVFGGLGQHETARAEIVKDVQFFSPVSLELPLYKKLHALFDYQGVIGNDVSDLRRMVWSSGVQYELSKNQAVQAGFNHIRQYPGQTRELNNGLYQAFIDHRKVKQTYVANIVLTEQEFLDGEGTSFKSTYRLSLGRQIRHTRWRALMSNDMVFNLNNVSGGPQQGLEQNRTFVGLGRCFTLRFCTRTGYQLQFINGRAGEADRLNHRIFMGLVMNATGPAHVERTREFP